MNLALTYQQKKFIEDNYNMLKNNEFIEFYYKAREKKIENIPMFFQFFCSIMYDSTQTWGKHIMSTIDSIPGGMFGGDVFGFGDSNIKEITIPDNVTVLEVRSFKQCVSLKTVYIPDTVYSIQSESFYNCVSLINVRLSEHSGLQSIAEKAFTFCPMEKIEIPKNIYRINTQAFNFCRNLKNIFLHTNKDLEIAEESFANIADDATIYYNGSSEQIKRLFDKIKNPAMAIKKGTQIICHADNETIIVGE